MKSIRTKLIFIMIFMLLICIGAFWLFSQLLLPSYYQYRKVSLLEECYQKSYEIIGGDENLKDNGSVLLDESMLELEILKENNAANLYVFSLTDFMGSYYYMYQYPSESQLSNIQKRDIEDKINDYILGLNYGDGLSGLKRKDSLKNREVIQLTDDFCVNKVFDERIGSYYLELFGVLDTGMYIYINTNYQSMSENVNIFSKFLWYIGIGVIVFAVILMVFISNHFTEPIMQLTDIAKSMSELNFEVKYPVTTKDEIGVLGSSINTLSEALEKTISELKTANNELQKDIENKIQIDEMRKEFLSNVSHELKTPIALIQGYAEGLQDNINDDSESREFYCEVIIDEADKMNRMVKKLLTLNQIEFGKDQFNFERFDIVPVLQSVMHSASILAEQKGASILMPDYEPVYVWADEYFVEEVVTNYVSNAINHVEGENKIEIFLSETGKTVRISVFNTGKCIPSDELDKVWIKFYKVDKARTRAYGGSGIGLSIVRAIMDSMNQKCGVFNHEDGVEFWFELDLH